MRWRYRLADRFNNKTRIDQPVGWDSLSFKLKRHAERHGTFNELQSNTFQFYNKAKDLLRAEYEQYGIRGRYDLIIDGKCNHGWEQLYRGRVSFDNYDYICGNECYVKVDLEQLGAVMEFINRFDQKVDLSSETSFDKTTALAEYEHLTKLITLPSKAILLRGISGNAANQEYIISKDIGFVNAFPTGTGTAQGAIVVPFASTQVNNIKDFKPRTVMDYFSAGNSEPIPDLLYNNPAQDLNCRSTQFTLGFRVKGLYKHLVAGSGSIILNLVLRKGGSDFYGGTLVQSWAIARDTTTGFLGVATRPFDIVLPETPFTILPGEKYWLNFYLTYTKTSNFNPDVRIEVHPETSIKISSLSKCDPTQSRIYMIHEATSRVVESITNNQLKLSSSYYGRKDSEPYSFPSDGCAGLRGITTGLDIRRAKLADGSDPRMFLSMKDIFESLNAIDNIGIGPEGTDKIVMENWRYFYKDEVVMKCKKIELVEKAIVPTENYSVFKFGFDKWESEDYNGLDEFLTKREYRTDLSEVQNPFEQLCKWIGSGYAWEVTRRKGPDSTDWRYDNDTFILCMTRRATFTGVFSAADNSVTIDYGGDPTPFASGIIQIAGTNSNNGFRNVFALNSTNTQLTIRFSGGVTVNETSSTISFPGISLPLCVSADVNNIDNPTNLLDPPTVYNFAISPLRNAMRWFNKVAACYRHISDLDKLFFSAGDGNYLASGKLVNATCRMENSELAENEDLSRQKFTDVDDANPFLRPERVKYTHSLSFEEYNILKANPHGLIDWESRCERGRGWIDEIEYFPEEGKAKFSLIPKVEL